MKKKIILSAFTGVVFFTAVFARHGEPCERMNKAGQWMKDSLNLTEVQSARIAAINDSACVKMKAIKEDNSLDQEARKAKMKEVMGKMRADYKAVLTEEQLAKLKEHRKANAGKHGKGGKGHANSTPEQKAEKMTEHMKTELGLSEDQTPKVKEANLALINQRKSVKDNPDLKNEDDRKKAMKSAMSAYNKTMKEILTDEQETKWKELKKARREEAGKHRKN